MLRMGRLVGIGVGKVEGDTAPEKKDWHGHVSVLTIAPEYRRVGYFSQVYETYRGIPNLCRNCLWPFFIEMTLSSLISMFALTIT